MRVLPVIARELRASARQSFTYALRVLGVLALLVVLGVFGLSGSIGPEIGGRLFSALHCALFVAVWVLVPVLTSDCISRERREGTLPLLFLTNLNPRDIVYAKGLAQGLRAFTLWLAVLPVLTIPLVAGGVGWPEVVVSALVNFSSICLATSAGLVASALARVWNRALALAFCLTVSLLVGFLFSLPRIVIGVSGLSFRRLFWMSEDGGLGLGIVFAINTGDMWQRFLSASRIGPWPVLRGYGALALLSLLVLAAWICVAAWLVRRVWREEPPSARVQWLQRTLFTPVVLRPVLNRWLRWQLRRNPIGWLEQRSWSGRLVVWSWFAVVICIYSSLFSNLSLYQRGFHQLQGVLASLLAGSIALSAAGSFRRERETGVLELLLVSPITEWQIIAGRVRGLWVQFLPAMILLVSVWLYSATFLSTDSELTSVVVYSVAFVALPVIGLYFSLAKNNIIVSLLWTLLVGVAVPAAIGRFAALWCGPDVVPEGAARTLIPCGLQMFFAFQLALRLHYNLKYRRFALSS
ncbi:MAG TPA: ABC transporter permease subunit [Verrucomicrobiae bacterium]